jgi:hypothetical protein
MTASGRSAGGLAFVSCDHGAPGSLALPRAWGENGEFRAEAARMKADLAPATGEDVQKLVARIYGDAAPGGRARQKAPGSVGPNATRPRTRVNQQSPKTCAKAFDRGARGQPEYRLGWRAACS